MESLPVTIIVKAPNQQFEDQTIKCEPTWSIRKLKGYLTEVYPCNPSLEEQKLIYSGQLLNDSHILKDILRQYEGQETHTVHLVYTPKNRPIQTSQNKSQAQKANSTSQQTSQPSLNTDGLRQRITSTASTTNAAQLTSTQPTFSNGFPYMTNPYAQLLPPQQLNAAQQQLAAQQMAVQNMMQQMYAQYVNQMAAYTQQWQSAAASGNAQLPNFVPTPFYAQNMTMPNMDSMAQPAAANAADVPNAVPPPRPPQPAAAADDDRENRDWLETLYTLSRLAVLLSLVYFYSSPGRCSIVIICIGLYYWYQNHQRNHRQQQPIDQAHEGEADVIENAERENDANPDQNPPPPAPEPGAVNPTGVNGSNDTSRTVDADENRLTTLALLRTIISSFFASLIPETPAV